MTHGQFAFTTHEAGNYLACFWVDGHVQGSGDVSVNIDWKTGIAAKDWDSVARKEKIEVSLLKIPSFLGHQILKTACSLVMNLSEPKASAAFIYALFFIFISISYIRSFVLSTRWRWRTSVYMILYLSKNYSEKSKTLRKLLVEDRRTRTLCARARACMLDCFFSRILNICERLLFHNKEVSNKLIVHLPGDTNIICVSV